MIDKQVVEGETHGTVEGTEPEGRLWTGMRVAQRKFFSSFIILASFDISFYIYRKRDFVHFVQLLASISYSDTLCTHVTPEPTPSSRATVDSHLYIILLNLRAGGLIEVNERCTTGR